MQTDLLAMIFSAPFFAAVIRSAVPIMGAAAGEAVYERAGVINIGLEGMMLMGAFCGVVGSMLTGSPWGGAFCALGGGMLVGLLHALLCVTLKAEVIVTGIAINFGVLGLTSFLSRTVFGPSPEPVAAFHGEPLPFFGKIPLLGEIFFSHIPLVYVIFILCLLLWFFLFRTVPGLRLRAVGESPFAAQASGVVVPRYAYVGALICGAVAGLSGACFSIGSVQYFSENMTSSNGFIALAVVIVARRNPLYCMLVSLVFAVGSALAMRMQGGEGSTIPYEFVLLLPYVLTLLVYGIFGKGPGKA